MYFTQHFNSYQVSIEYLLSLKLISIINRIKYCKSKTASSATLFKILNNVTRYTLLKLKNQILIAK